MEQPKSEKKKIKDEVPTILGQGTTLSNKSINAMMDQVVLRKEEEDLCAEVFAKKKKCPHNSGHYYGMCKHPSQNTSYCTCGIKCPLHICPKSSTCKFDTWPNEIEIKTPIEILEELVLELKEKMGKIKSLSIEYIACENFKQLQSIQADITKAKTEKNSILLLLKKEIENLEKL